VPRKYQTYSSRAIIGTNAPYDSHFLNPSKVRKNSIALRSKISPPLEARSRILSLILERVGAAFKDASGFLNDSAEDAKESSVTKLNPLQK